MIILNKKNFYIPHKHKRKGETYHIIKGSMILSYSKKMEKLKLAKLTKVKYFELQSMYSIQCFQL